MDGILQFGFGVGAMHCSEILMDIDSSNRKCVTCRFLATTERNMKRPDEKTTTPCCVLRCAILRPTNSNDTTYMY